MKLTVVPDGLWRRRLAIHVHYLSLKGRMIYEMGGVAENIAGKAISVAAPKIPKVPLEKSTRLPKVPLPFHFSP
jgi:hypothetical protein